MRVKMSRDKIKMSTILLFRKTDTFLQIYLSSRSILKYCDIVFIFNTLPCYIQNNLWYK